MEKDKKIMIGYKTIILGLCLYIVELLYLPVFGALQKTQVSGNGFYSDFWKYTGQQPYPIIFLLTGDIRKRSNFRFINAPPAKILFLRGDA